MGKIIPFKRPTRRTRQKPPANAGTEPIREDTRLDVLDEIWVSDDGQRMEWHADKGKRPSPGIITLRKHLENRGGI